jgi:hypothetical protein
MAISQNVTFNGEAGQDAEFEHPPGASLARYLETELRKSDWTVSEFDNWRGCGWCLECSRDNARLQLAFVEGSPGAWFLQIAPLRGAGPFARLFRRTPSATPSDVLALAKTVHALLNAQGQFRGFQWCWDGPPDEGNSTPEPTE